jgi:general stress protein 26
MPALPYPVARLIDSALVGELTVVGPDGAPITYPMIPLLWGERIYMTSSVMSAAKVEHIKANHRVSFSITDPAATGPLKGRITIQCDARIADDNLHSGWEKLLENWKRKDPAVTMLLRDRMAFPLLFERVLIELTPRKSWFWPDGRLEKEPQVSIAAEVAR